MGQYDFQTIVTHELGHATGLGHSGDEGSVMYPYLSAGEVRHGVTARDMSVLEASDGAPEPLLAHQSGWFDGDGIGSKLNYLKMASHGHPYQKLVLGPWGHTDEAQRRGPGERDFGADAMIDLPRAYLRWFDYWLKGIDDGIAKEPLVSVFVMGSNRWLKGNTYPLENTRFEKWYLTSSRKANTSKGDGRLTTELPAVNAVNDSYVYDPADPTPDPESYEEPEDSSKKEKASEEKKKAEEAYHVGTTDKRSDILVFTSEPFKEAYTFAGPLSGVL